MSKPASAHLLAACLSLCLAGSALADTAQDVATANAHLKRAEANLQLVDSSIGRATSTPTGSKAKLAKMRLDQAIGDIGPAGTLLAKLPQSDATVAEAVKRHAAAVALATRLQNILTGNTAPAPGTPGSGAPASGDGGADAPASGAGEVKPDTVRLGYQQVDALRGAAFNLREVEGNAKTLTETVETMRAVEDQLSVDFRQVKAALETVANGIRKAGFVKTALEALPANGEGGGHSVADIKQRLVTADAKVRTAEMYLKDLDAKLGKVLDPAVYPNCDADLKRLREIGVMYNDPMQLQNNPVTAANAVKQLPAANNELKRIIQTYARLIQQQTEMGKAIAGSANALITKAHAFVAAGDQVKETLPAQMDAGIQAIQKMAEEAVANRRPAWFTGGIPQQVGFVDDKLVLLEALDAEAGQAMAEKITELKASLAKQADSLSQLIVQQNTLPADAYEGDDRAAAIAIAVDAWKHQEEDFEVLAIAIPATTWARKHQWEYHNGTWYLVDRSRLQVQLAIASKTDPTVAIIRPINVWKDHLKADAMIGVPLWGADDPVQPSSKMLKANLPKP